MKTKDADILIIPGHGNSGPDHWQTRWERRLSSARRVEQADWERPEREPWAQAVADAANSAKKPVIFVAHSLGVPTALNALPLMSRQPAGAFLVAPPDLDNPDLEPARIVGFGPYPRAPLPFPSITVGSNNDPHCTLEVADELAAAWGSLFVNAGEAGHINSAAGYGPWPEGTMVFAQFLSRLGG